MREVLLEYGIPRMARVLQAVWGRKRWEVYVSLNRSYFSGITERTRGRVRRLRSRLRRLPLWNRDTTKYLGWEWWGAVEGFHREENVELENALRIQHGMMWCLITATFCSEVSFCLHERLLRISYASSSKGMTMLSNRPSSVVGINILQEMPFKYCVLLGTKQTWKMFSHSPYLSQEKQLLRSVQDCQ